MVDSSWHYRICIQGLLDPSWSDWFGGLGLSHDKQGNTVLAGRIADQAALQGLLNKIFSLGLALLSLNRTAGGARASNQPYDKSKRLEDGSNERNNQPNGHCASESAL